MKRHLLLLLIFGLFSAVGCECTHHHLLQHKHCLFRGHKYPYSCPPCPYYDPVSKEWTRTPEVYTGIQ